MPSFAFLLVKRLRVLFLQVTLLVALLAAEVMFANKFGQFGLLLRTFGWTTCAYGGWVLVYAAYCGWFAWRKRTPEPEDVPEIDKLTGLMNRKGIISELAKPVYARFEGGRRTRLIHVEIRSLERVNLEFGWAVGNGILEESAAALKSQVPSDWKIGRVGGREFVVIAPMAEAAEVAQVCETIEHALAQDSAAGGLTVLARPAPYEFDGGTLQQALTQARSFPGTGTEAVGDTGEEVSGPHHLPEVTLGAFAANLWDSLPAARQVEFLRWQKEPDRDFINLMLDDVTRILDIRSEHGDIDFVTLPPSLANWDQKQRAATETFGRKLAERRGIPFRKVLRGVAHGDGSAGDLEPRLDVVLNPGTGVLLVQDQLFSPELVKRCIATLSLARAHVVALVWTTKPSTAIEPGTEHS